MNKKITVKTLKDGPYEVSGLTEIKEQIIIPNEEGASWNYKDAKNIEIKEPKVCLCRCGNSKNKPFCDGSHTETHFDGTCSASHQPILDNAEAIPGPNYTLYDNESYCAFARFCDAFGRVWNLVEEGSEQSDKLAIRETINCPAGRLLIKDNKTGEFLEPAYEASISILEDPAIGVSGPLYAKGDVTVEDEHGKAYECRNRQTLCRCGNSRNKPFCDGTHASSHFDDGNVLPRKSER